MKKTQQVLDSKFQPNAPLLRDSRVLRTKVEETLAGIRELSEQTAAQFDSEFMMFINHKLPELRVTEEWTYKGQRPNPISISKARLYLSSALADITCYLPGTGEHGYAWMIDTADEWRQRSGNEMIEAPDIPKYNENFDMQTQMIYAIEMREYEKYKHLMQETKAKIIEWFTKPMFVDLWERGRLPHWVTAKELLAHISDTYAPDIDCR